MSDEPQRRRQRIRVALWTLLLVYATGLLVLLVHEQPAEDPFGVALKASYEGKYDRAIADFTTALHFDPNDAEAQGNLDRVRAALGR